MELRILHADAPSSPLGFRPPIISATSGSLTVRLACDPAEIAAAQALRYRVFYEEMAATPSAAMADLRRDFDEFDGLCDHLVVIDQTRAPENRVVGTYRLIRDHVAARAGRWYSESEFALRPAVDAFARGGALLELGRSCVDPAYRSNATIQLLWRGIAAYMQAYDVSAMFGCASLAGTDPAQLALPLSYLHHFHRAPEDLAVRPVAGRHAEMNLMPADAINPRRAVTALPPLIKAYLRLGAYIGDGAVIDHQFGTTDVFILLPVERIPAKYLAHFDSAEQEACAA